jgi:adenylosuccinate synthase
MNELEVLKKKNIKPIIYVNGKCPVTTPFDVFYNKKLNDQTGHGSCGVGFGATIEREEKHYSLLVEDLQFPRILNAKLNLIMKWYNSVDHESKNNFLSDCFQVMNNIQVVYENPYHYHVQIYEGSQGLLLDKDIGFFPHVTRGNVSSKRLTGVNKTYYVTRAYQTRHGNGPMTNENLRHNIKENPNETNVKNYQGEFRRSLLDLDLLKYALMKDRGTESRSLVITCLDHVQNDLRFTYQGQIIYNSTESEFISKIGEILGFKDIYISKSEEYSNIYKF